VAGTAKTRGDSTSVALLDAPTPPQSIEAEQAVLGGLLLDAAAWDNVADAVTREDFYRPDHRLIFAAIAALAGEGKPCDVVTVSQHLEHAGQLEEAGGLAYLSSVARDTPSAANVRAYADIVRERSLLRQLIRAGTDIAASAYNASGETASTLVDRAEQRVFEIAEGSFTRREGAVSVRTLLPGVIDQIDEWHHNPDKLRGLPTGFTDFDKLTGGLRPGDLVIVAGRPSMGKTTLAVNMAEYAAVHPGTRASVAIFSMEMPSEQVITRMLASIGGVPLNNLRSGKISDEDWVRITSATSQLSEAKIFVDETPALNPTELRARARRVKREHGLNLIVIDYLQLMQVPGTQENRATEIAEISRGLKALAKELQVPVIALSQLNRAVEQREHKKPVMSDLRECVTADTLVCLTDGRRVPIARLEGSAPEVWSIDEKQRLVRARADKVWRVGRRPVFKVMLASGRSIRATAEHRLLAGAGWTTVATLRAGDRLALARRLPEPAEPQCWPDQGIVARIHTVKPDRGRPVHMVWVSGAESQQAFLQQVRAFGPRRMAAAALEQALGGVRANPNVDTLPREEFAAVRAEMRAQGITQRAMAGLRGTSYGGSSHFRFCPSRGRMANSARLLGRQELAQWASSDLFWDRVIASTPDGEEDVFDLTVPGPACWLADGIASHNSGAIEQEADMILLIYREEVYDRNTPKKGVAEIDLVKHRNGEIGMFFLTFQGQYTRFANYAPDSYAAGVLR
jgi:replicative DNA helicase